MIRSRQNDSTPEDEYASTALAYVLLFFHSLRSATTAAMGVYMLTMSLGWELPLVYVSIFGISKLINSLDNYHLRFRLFLTGTDPFVYWGNELFEKEKKLCEGKFPRNLEKQEKHLKGWMKQYVLLNNLNKFQKAQLKKYVDDKYFPEYSKSTKTDYSEKQTEFNELKDELDQWKGKNKEQLKNSLTIAHIETYRDQLFLDFVLGSETKEGQPTICEFTEDELRHYFINSLRAKLDGLKRTIHQQAPYKVARAFSLIFALSTHIVLGFLAAYGAEIVMEMLSISGAPATAVVTLLGLGGLVGSYVTNHRSYQKYANACVRSLSVRGIAKTLSNFFTGRKLIAFIVATLTTVSVSVFGYMGLERHLLEVVVLIWKHSNVPVPPVLPDVVDGFTLFLAIASGLGYLFYAYRSTCRTLKPSKVNPLEEKLEPYTAWQWFTLGCSILAIGAAVAGSFYSIDLKFGLISAIVFSVANLLFNISTNASNPFKHFLRWREHRRSQQTASVGMPTATATVLQGEPSASECASHKTNRLLLEQAAASFYRPQ